MHEVPVGMHSVFVLADRSSDPLVNHAIRLQLDHCHYNEKWKTNCFSVETVGSASEVPAWVPGFIAGSKGFRLAVPPGFVRVSLIAESKVNATVRLVWQ